MAVCFGRRAEHNGTNDMTLFDIDKDGADRGSPSPNHHDKIISGAIRAAGTISENHITSIPSDQQVQLKAGFGRLVQTGTIAVGPATTTLTTASFAHNLGYVPIMVAALNNAIVSGIIENVSIFLPTHLTASIGGVTSGAVTFGAYLFGSISEDNIYFQIFNATGSTIPAVDVTYYLYQQPAAPAE